jgi:probable rRNA maturation factor
LITLCIVNRQRKVRLSQPELEKMAYLALPHCLKHTGGSEAILSHLTAIEITIVSDKVISSLHKRFFNDASPTDVITFPHGEIIISAETAAANGEKYGHSATMETVLCIIHGFLHLNGYDDQTSQEASKMAERQNAILEAIYRKV